MLEPLKMFEKFDIHNGNMMSVSSKSAHTIKVIFVISAQVTVTPAAVSQPKKKMSVGFSSLSWESVMSQSVTSLHRSMKHLARFLCRNPVISTFSKGCIFFVFYPTISKFLQDKSDQKETAV